MIGGPFSSQVLYLPLLPWLGREPLPSLEDLNREAETRGLVAGGGFPLRFVATNDHQVGYEFRLYCDGIAETRPANWHDYFGALVWLAFPRAKAVINRRHFQALNRAGAGSSRPRCPVRDTLTQLDECGLVVLSRNGDLWAEICQHRWREVFFDRRREVLADMRFLLFGHGSYDSLRMPFVGLCAKAVCFPVDDEVIDGSVATQVAVADDLLAGWLEKQAELNPRMLQPLPLLGIPGVTPDNDNPQYYEDTRQFRPRRPVQSGWEVR